MSKYNGLDKMSDGEIKLLKFVETYRGVKIYMCEQDDHPSCNRGYVAVSRKYTVDSCLADFKHAKDVVDHFHEPMSVGH
jgi:hypothetical protein